jgi:hypothetical protein
MKSKLFLLVGVIVLLVSGGWASYGGQKDIKWEYTVVRAMNDPKYIQGQLNSLGNAGWDLVSATELPVENTHPSQSFVTLYLRRAR